MLDDLQDDLQTTARIPCFILPTDTAVMAAPLCNWSKSMGHGHYTESAPDGSGT